MKAKAKLTTRIERMDLRELELLDLNARYMRHETFKQLIENVARDGVLTSVPFAVKNAETGKYRVLSGNHRVQAAIEAGIFEADVMVSDDELTEQHQIALQLSHNALVGEDDPSLLAQLYEKLDDVDWRAYSGLDDKVLELLEEIQVGALNEAALTWQAISLVFLPEEVEEVEAALADARSQVAGDKTYLARWGQYDEFMDALAEAAAAHGVMNQATALEVVLAIYRDHREDLRSGYIDEEGKHKHSSYVPVASALGTDRIPAQSAALLVKALEAFVGRGEIPADKPWLVIDKLCEGRVE